MSIYTDRTYVASVKDRSIRKC